MKRLKTSLKGITCSFYSIAQDERFIAFVPDQYKWQVMSGNRFLNPAINP